MKPRSFLVWYLLPLLAVVVMALIGGCATVAYNEKSGDFASSTLFKDVAGKAQIEKPDGTKISIDITSNTDEAAIKSITEGATAGAVRAALKP